MGKSSDLHTLEPLINWLEFGKSEAAIALGYLGDTRAVLPLINALNATEEIETDWGYSHQRPSLS
jgi:HEAT repeat protein